MVVIIKAIPMWIAHPWSFFSKFKNPKRDIVINCYRTGKTLNMSEKRAQAIRPSTGIVYIRNISINNWLFTSIRVYYVCIVYTQIWKKFRLFLFKDGDRVTMVTPSSAAVLCFELFILRFELVVVIINAQLFDFSAWLPTNR